MTFDKIKREQVYQKLNGHCAYCGEQIDIKEMQIDHIIPKYNFASRVQNKYKIPPFLTHLKETDLHHIDNLMPTCRVCNNWKSAFDIERFRLEIFEQVKRLNDYSSNFRMAKKYGLVAETVRPIVFYFEQVINKQQSIPEEFQKIVNDNFMNFIANEIKK